MFVMIASVEEIKEIIQIYQEVKEGLITSSITIMTFRIRKKQDDFGAVKQEHRLRFCGEIDIL